MNFTKLLMQMPLVVNLHKSLTNPIRSILNQRILNELSNTSYPQGMNIKEIVEQLDQQLPPSEQNWIAKIENQRKYLLSRNEQLNDGSLGKGGLCDGGQTTIKQECEISKLPKSALMLYLITRAVNPQKVIELGTNLGISSSYIGAALKVNGKNGRLITLDASPYRLKIAKEIHQNLGLDNIAYVEGLFTDTLSSTLRNMNSIDLAFIDGHHQYQPTLDYFEEILGFAKDDTVFVFDDIRWSDGMKKAWLELQSDRRLGLIVDCSSMGICVRRQETISQRYVLPPLRIFNYEWERLLS
jgi:predicted O-methyltransferase YrrM